jgi:hypothetical protein
MFIAGGGRKVAALGDSASPGQSLPSSKPERANSKANQMMALLDARITEACP